MANLQESARQLVEQIAELDTDVESAAGTLTRLRERLQAAEKELDERIGALEEEVEDFVTRVGEETSQLAASLDAADAAMNGARDAADGARTPVESAIGAATQAAQASTTDVERTQEGIEAAVTTQAEGAAAELGDRARAATTSVEEAMDLASGNVARLTDALVELQQTIPGAADGAGKAIETADEHLGEAFVEWTSRLFEVVDLVRNSGFEPAQENAEEVASYALDQAREGLAEVVQAAFDRTAELARDLEALQQAIGQAAAQVTAENAPLVSEIGELRESLTAAAGWLETVEEWLGSYTFMKA